MTDKLFAGKIAFFNAVGFSTCAAAITYVDARLTTHVVHGVRDYPGGYAVAVIGGLIIFAITFAVLFSSASWLAKIGTPAVIVVLAGALATPYFQPEVPHAGLVEWLLQIAVLSLLTCFVHFWQAPTDRLRDEAINLTARIEWIKEHAVLWRTIAISTMLGVVALVVPWSQFVWKMPESIVTDSKEALLVGQFGALNIVVVCVYTLFGIIYESFLKASQTADNLLLIKASRGD